MTVTKKKAGLKKQVFKKPLLILLAIACILILPAVSFADSGKPATPDKKANSCRILRSMARIYMAYGEYAKAQPLAEQALAVAKATNSPDTETSCCLIDLAWLYNNQGKMAEAENLCRSGLELQEKAYYKEHPYVAYTLRILTQFTRVRANTARLSPSSKKQ